LKSWRWIRANTDHLTEAIATGEQLWATFGEATEPEIQASVALGLNNLALFQAADDQLEAAIASGERLIRTWGGVTELSELAEANIRATVERFASDVARWRGMLALEA
jgi:hypothetical protein